VHVKVISASCSEIQAHFVLERNSETSYAKALNVKEGNAVGKPLAQSRSVRGG